MGTKVSPDERGVPGAIMYRVGVVDKNKGVKCRTCGRWVEFDTDRNGRLQAYNHDLTKHGCKEA